MNIRRDGTIVKLFTAEFTAEHLHYFRASAKTTYIDIDYINIDIKYVEYQYRCMLYSRKGRKPDHTDESNNRPLSR